MLEVNPEHKKNVIYDNGQNVLYLPVVRTIYGCIESDFLWYKLYDQTLQKNGFNINPYER